MISEEYMVEKVEGFTFAFKIWKKVFYGWTLVFNGVADMGSEKINTLEYREKVLKAYLDNKNLNETVFVVTKKPKKDFEIDVKETN